MKYTMNLLCLLALAALVSCTPGADTQPNTGAETENTQAQETVIESGSVVLELQNPSPLAGETLNFDVKIEKITKAEANTQTDVVEANDDIEVHYVGTLDNGEQFDSSYDREQTLPFTVGIGQMIPGFDAGVVGLALGEEKSLVLAPEDAYGPATISETVTIADLRTFVGPDFEIAVGAVIPTAGGDATIIEIQE